MRVQRPNRLRSPSSTVTRKPGMEAARGPARPALVATVAPRIEETNDEADHDHRTAPDTIAGPGLVLPPHGMSTRPPPAIARVQGAPRDDRRRGGGARSGPRRGGRMRGGATRDDRHRGGAERSDPPRRRCRLNGRGPTMPRDWPRNCWKHQPSSLCPNSPTWRPWLKLWLLPYWPR